MKMTEEEERGGKVRCSDGVHVRDNRRKRAGRRRFSQVRGQLLVTEKSVTKIHWGKTMRLRQLVAFFVLPERLGCELRKQNKQK